MATHDKNDSGEKTWNNQKKKSDVNEGFSGENIPENYNPAKHVSETETDSRGETREVKRARNADRTDEKAQWQPSDDSGNTAQNQKIREEKIKGNEDRNYDDANRYPAGHPENKKDRGNMDLDD